MVEHEGYVASMADANTQATGSSLAREAPMPDWLPRARATPLLDRVLTMTWLRQRQNADCFAGLAVLMCLKRSGAYQGRILAKVYIFIREYMPRGLVGRWEHISGRDVMEYLLAGTKEQCVTRHPATKSVVAGFRDLEKWMARGATWQDALANARDEASQQRHSKRETAGLAPGLVSPAAMLALLALGYPEPKYHDWIATLQIGWMMTEARETLEVREGFWKGLTSKNITEVFAPENDPCRTESCLFMDFDGVFGSWFMLCRRDIRPYLPNHAWRSQIIVPSPIEDSDLFSDVEDTADNEPDSDAENTPPASSSSSSAFSVQKSTGAETPGNSLDGLKILPHLDPEAASTADVKAWLAKIAAGSTHNSVLFQWCTVWAERARDAQDFQDQLLVHSLILQSLRRLKSLYSSGPPSSTRVAVEAYMLLEIGDVQSQPCPTQEDIEQLGTCALYKTCAELHDEFKLRVCTNTTDMPSGVATMLDQIFERQAAHIISIIKTQRSQRVIHALMLEKNRTKAQLEIFWSRTGRNPSYPHVKLWEKHVVAALKLTDWQLRESFRPAASLEQVLTNWQLSVYNEWFGTASGAEDFSDIPPFGYRDVCGLPGAEKQDSLAIVLSDLMDPSPTCTCGARALITASVPAGKTWSDGLIPGPLSRAAQSTSPPLQVSGAPRTPLAQAQNPPHGMITSHAGGAVAAAPGRAVANPSPSSGTKRAAGPDQRSAKAPRLGNRATAGPAEGAQAANAPEGATGSPLAGQEGDPSAAGRARQAPGAGGPVRDTVIEEFTALKAELGRRLSSLHAQQAVVSDTSARMGIRLPGIQSLAHPEERVPDIVREDNQRLRGDLASHNDALNARLDAMDTKMDDMHWSIHQMQGEVRDDFDMRLAASREDLRALASSLEDLKSAGTAPAPSAGEPGYLASHCPAPEGTGQKAYEARLHQAAIYYFSLFGHPSGGVPWEGESFQATERKFPTLSCEHLVAALEHMHMLVYNQPLGQ